MSRAITILLVLALVGGTAFAQLSSVATHNSYQTKFLWTGPDSTKPFRNDQGIRSAWVTKDMDKDGKPEIMCTDYANGGRVHVFEFKAPNILELVWSSPNMYQTNANSTPRWVKDGDLDGDGNREIIFPVGPALYGQGCGLRVQRDRQRLRCNSRCGRSGIAGDAVHRASWRQFSDAYGS